MKKRNLILMLIENSVNAFGEVIGLTEDTKLKVTLTVIQDTVKNAFDIDSNLLTRKTLSEVLVKEKLDLDETRLLANLLWIKADLLLKLNQPIESLVNYENTLLLIQWHTQQVAENKHLEKQNKIDELIAVINELKPTKNKLNYN